jgi:RNA recognition motif-containing protein
MEDENFIKQILEEVIKIRILGNAEWKKEKAHNIVLDINKYLKQKEKARELAMQKEEQNENSKSKIIQKHL